MINKIDQWKSTTANKEVRLKWEKILHARMKKDKVREVTEKCKCCVSKC